MTNPVLPVAILNIQSQFTQSLTHDFSDLSCDVTLLGRQHWEVRDPLPHILRDMLPSNSHRQNTPSTRTHVSVHRKFQLGRTEATLGEMFRKHEDDSATPGHGSGDLFHDWDPRDEVPRVPAEPVGGGARLQGREEILKHKVAHFIVGTDKGVVHESIVCKGEFSLLIKFAIDIHFRGIPDVISV